MRVFNFQRGLHSLWVRLLYRRMRCTNIRDWDELCQQFDFCCGHLVLCIKSHRYLSFLRHTLLRELCRSSLSSTARLFQPRSQSCALELRLHCVQCKQLSCSATLCRESNRLRATHVQHKSERRPYRDRPAQQKVERCLLMSSASIELKLNLHSVSFNVFQLFSK